MFAPKYEGVGLLNRIPPGMFMSRPGGCQWLRGEQLIRDVPASIEAKPERVPAQSLIT